MPEQITLPNALDHADVQGNLDAIEAAVEQNLAALGNKTGAVTINPATAEVQTMTLTGNVTVAITAGAFNGQRLALVMTQDGTGSRTFTAGTLCKLAGGEVTLTTTATTGKDILEFVFTGTNWDETNRSLAIA